MSFMPYVPPEQLMKDRSEYAQKGIARGKSVVGIEYAAGLLFIAENPSTDRKSTRLNSSHTDISRMPSSA